MRQAKVRQALASDLNPPAFSVILVSAITMQSPVRFTSSQPSGEKMSARITRKAVRKTPPTKFAYIATFRQCFSYIFWAKKPLFSGAPGR
jgi:hypothetical protein